MRWIAAWGPALFVAIVVPATGSAAVAGDLDPTFSGDGHRTLSGFAVANDVVVQADGKILLGGVTGGAGTEVAALVRFRPDGEPDSGGFATNGFITDSRALAFDGIDLLASGKILAVGRSEAAGSFAFYVARFDADGAPDLSFGGGDGWIEIFPGAGEQVTGVGDLVVQPDGRIVVAGTIDCGGCPNGADFAVYRLSADGSAIEAGFGTGIGIGARVHFGTTADFATDVALQDDGKIVVGGRTAGNFAVARLQADGSIDDDPVDGFGAAGGTTTNFSGVDRGEGLLIRPDGRIVLAGAVNSAADFGLARYTTGGALDPGFGGGGKVITDFGATDGAFDIVRQGDGRLVAAGASGGDFALARYAADGSPDPAFSGNGRSTADLGGTDRGLAVALAPEGKIVVAGDSVRPGASSADLAVARFLAVDDPSIPGGTGGGSDGGGGDGDGGAGDTDAPAIRLGAKKRQAAGKPIRVRLRSNEDAAAIFKGRIVLRRSASAREPRRRARIRLRRFETNIAAGETERAKLRPAGPRRRAARKLERLERAVEDGARARARVVAVATDPAGNRAKARVGVKLTG